MAQGFLTNHFLLAMPRLADPNFHQSVTYICEHNDNGAMGIIINRPSELSLGEIFRQMDIAPQQEHSADIAVYSGGPVQQDRGFVLHTPAGKWESSMRISTAISVTTSRDILSAVAKGAGPKRLLIALGYAGWGAGQLEYEMAENAWLSMPADPEIIFNTPYDKRWHSAARLLGVDPLMLSSDTGHA